MYRVLLTVNADGQMLTHLPTAERLVGDAFEDYTAALVLAKSLRTAIYQHKGTGEQRSLSELDTSGAVFREDTNETWELARFVRVSTMIAPRAYALVVDEKDLPLYEPKSGRK